MERQLDKNKICFITCVNDERKYEECLLYLRHLLLPPHMTVEVIPVREAAFMTAGYQAAMLASDARYKVYLHQDVCLVKKDMILRLLRIFQQQPAAGMIGLSGCRCLPASGIWWETKSEVYGMIVQGIRPDYIELVRYDHMQEEYAPVEAIDGLFMMTQQDIPWREDIFQGWHFYDISQSMEFRRRGLQVIVPRQQEPWCIHDCGRLHMDEEYEHWRRIFLQTYVQGNGEMGTW